MNSLCAEEGHDDIDKGRVVMAYINNVQYSAKSTIVRVNVIISRITNRKRYCEDGTFMHICSGLNEAVLPDTIASDITPFTPGYRM